MNANDEYNQLNIEIRENATKVYTVLNFCILGNGALLALSFGANFEPLPYGNALRPFAALLPFAVILPSVILVESSANSTVRIATYLSVVHENGEGASWQRAIQKSRQKNPKSRRSINSFFWTFLALMTVSVIISLGFFAWTFHELQAGSPSRWPDWGVEAYWIVYSSVVIALVGISIRLLLTMRECFSANAFAKWEKTWRRVLFLE